MTADIKKHRAEFEAHIRSRYPLTHEERLRRLHEDADRYARAEIEEAKFAWLAARQKPSAADVAEAVRLAVLIRNLPDEAPGFLEDAASLLLRLAGNEGSSAAKTEPAR